MLIPPRSSITSDIGAFPQVSSLELSDGTLRLGRYSSPPAKNKLSSRIKCHEFFCLFFFFTAECVSGSLFLLMVAVSFNACCIYIKDDVKPVVLNREDMRLYKLLSQEERSDSSGISRLNVSFLSQYVYISHQNIYQCIVVFVHTWQHHSWWLDHSDPSGIPAKNPDNGIILCYAIYLYSDIRIIYTCVYVIRYNLLFHLMRRTGKSSIFI